jgi:hypothetical protein
MGSALTENVCLHYKRKHVGYKKDSNNLHFICSLLFYYNFGSPINYSVSGRKNVVEYKLVCVALGVYSQTSQKFHSSSQNFWLKWEELISLTIT